MPEYKPYAPKPLSESESKTSFTIKSNIMHSKFKKAEEIKGGKGDNKSDKEFDPEELKAGKKIEKEHTPDKDKVKEISKDHLTEIPDYYKRLKKMESQAEKEGKMKVKKSFDRANALIKSMKEAIDEDEMDIKKKLLAEIQDRYKRSAAERNLPKGILSKSDEDTKKRMHLGYVQELSKALKASSIIGLSRKERLNVAYQAGLAAGTNQYFEVEPISIPLDPNIGVSKERLRSDHEPPIVPIRAIETPFAIPPRECGDHEYKVKKAGPQESLPFWRR
jgi:hypothetical protein